MNMNSETGSNLIHMLGTPREKQQCGIAIKFLGMWKLYFSGQDMWSKAEFPNVKLSGRQSFIFKNFTTVGENFSHLKTSDRFFFLICSTRTDLYPFNFDGIQKVKEKQRARKLREICLLLTEKQTIKTIWVLHLSILQYSSWLSNRMTFSESEWGRRGDKCLNKTIKYQWTTLAVNVPSFWMNVLVSFPPITSSFPYYKNEDTCKWTETLLSQKCNLHISPSYRRIDCGMMF